MKTNLSSKFGQRMKALRESNKMSQEDLAFQTGLHRTYISDLERGSRNPSLKTLATIAEAFNITLSKLLNGVEYE